MHGAVPRRFSFLFSVAWVEDWRRGMPCIRNRSPTRFGAPYPSSPGRSRVRRPSLSLRIERFAQRLGRFVEVLSDFHGSFHQHTQPRDATMACFPGMISIDPWWPPVASHPKVAAGCRRQQVAGPCSPRSPTSLLLGIVKQHEAA